MAISVFQKALNDLPLDGQYESDTVAGLKVALRLADALAGEDNPASSTGNYWSTVRAYLQPFLGRSAALNLYNETIGSLEYKASR